MLQSILAEEELGGARGGKTREEVLSDITGYTGGARGGPEKETTSATTAQLADRPLLSN